MPKNRKEETIYTIMMVIVMVYAMVCYNIAMDVGGMKNFVFLAALSELPIMLYSSIFTWYIYSRTNSKKSSFQTGKIQKKISQYLLFWQYQYYQSGLCVRWLSFVAVVLFKNAFGPQLIAVWIQTTIINFPMAFFWQLFAAGPLVRTIFGKIFK